MLGTLISIFIAAAVQYLTFLGVHPAVADLSRLFLVIGITFLLAPALIYAYAFRPLQSCEQGPTPSVLELVRKDSTLGYVRLLLILFALISLGMSLYAPLVNSYPYSLTAWILFLGVASDALHHLYKKLLDYLNPIAVVTLFRHEANRCIQEEKEVDLCHWIDALCETSIKAIGQDGTALCNYALTEAQQLTRLFLEASKSISHRAQDKQTQEYGIRDKISYTLFYLYQRLELVNNRAIERRLEPTCSHLITLLGKIAIDSAKCDISLAIYPLHYLGKFSRKALKKGLKDVADTATCTFLGVAQEILASLDVTYLEIRDPYLSIVKGLEEIAKATFQSDKSANIKIIAQPLRDLRLLFQNEKYANHPDTEVILANIDRALGEFDALELVMNTIPTIPSDVPDTPTIVDQ